MQLERSLHGERVLQQQTASLHRSTRSSSSSLFKIMKFSTSTTSHASPLSSSISTNTTPMCNTKSTTTSGCLTAILRKILCSGTLPKDPSNQIEELDSSSKSTLSVKDQNFNASEAATPPPLVARLMGLESMGEIQTKPSSLSRSRSMNSVDYFGECNRMQSLHKRVNSTLSFREAPSFLLTENENFLVLSFENERKKQMGCEELKQKVGTERVELKENNKSEKGKKQSKKGSDMSNGNGGNRCKFEDITNTSKTEGEKKCFDSEEAVKLSPEAMNCKKLKRKKKRTHCNTENKIEVECKSEDSSPVSVLDFERESCGTDSFADDLNSRRKLTPELENDRLLLLRSDGSLLIDERKIKVKAIENNNYEGSKKKEKNNKEYVDIWGGVCRIVEDELGGSNQIHAWMNKQSDLKSIIADFESEIFDQLLNEMIDQFVGCPLTSL